MPYLAISTRSLLDADPAETLEALTRIQAAPLENRADGFTVLTSETRPDPTRLRSHGLELATWAASRDSVERYLSTLEPDTATWELTMPPTEYLARYPNGPHADTARAVLANQ